jgi:AcrR family transcriptional regulator
MTSSNKGATYDRARTADTRTLIVETASDMFVRRGYNGVSFLLIGKSLGISHSNVHYYFKTKDALAEVVLTDYCTQTIDLYADVWRDAETTLVEKCLATRDWIYQRYITYNPAGHGGKVWGLLTRFSIDADLLPPGIKTRIKDTESQIESLVREGVSIALRTGELEAGAPGYEIGVQISTLMQLSMQVTRYSGSFQRFDDLLRWTCDAISRAYGARHTPAVWRSPSAAPADVDRLRAKGEISVPSA